MTNRRLGSALVLLLGLAGTPAAPASPWAETGDTGLRHDLQMLEDAGILQGVHGTWPVPWNDITRQLDDYDGDRLIPTVARVRARARRAGPGAGLKGAVRVRATGEPQVLRGFTDTPREQGEARLQAGYTGERFAGRFSGTRVDDARDGENPRFDGSFVSTRLGNWQFGAGALDRWWGPGWDGSMILSNNARPVPGVFLERDSSAGFDHPWLAWIGPWRLSTFLGQLESDRTIQNPRYFGMRLTTEPTRGLTIGLQRTMIFGGRGESSSLSTFWDLWIGRSNEGVNAPIGENPGAQTAGWDVRFNFERFGVPAAFYTQYIGQDRYTLPTANIGQFGLETWGELGDGGTWRAFLEYANTLASFTSGNGWLNVTYNHSVWRDGHRHKGQPIGHSIDGDGRVWSTGVVYNTAAGHTLEAVARVALLNRNDRQRTPEPLFEANTRARAALLRYSAPFGAWTVTGHAGVQDFSPDLPENHPPTSTAGIGFERRF